MKRISTKKFVAILENEISNLKVEKDKSFKQLTTFKIGGRIKYLIEINEVNTLLKILHLCKEYSIKYFVLGQGSNILASDKTCYTLVLKINLKSFRVRQNKIICGAGLTLFKLNNIAMENGLGGLEWSFGIPGSVGGAVKMNAGSFGGEMKDVVESVCYTDGDKIYKKQKKALDFDYRKSFFSNNNYIILKVVFSLTPKNPDQIKQECLKNYNFRLSHQPYSLPSAGSVFKRPQNQFAPVLIENCKLKGLSCGGAQISPKHCGFIVNTDGKATFFQVSRLIAKIKKTVLKKFGIILEEEIIIFK